jgi:transcriptional regulator with XRE-family HTH domain
MPDATPTKRMPAAPVTDFPLREATLQRRIWALYLSKGFTRASFARLLGLGYTVIVNWDNETHTPRLKELTDIAIKLDVSLDLLVFGEQGRPPPPPLSQGPHDHEAILRALDRVNASEVARAAFGEHSASPAGRYQRITAAYAERYARCVDAHLADGVSLKKAMEYAFAEAVNARALASAVARRSNRASESKQRSDESTGASDAAELPTKTALVTAKPARPARAKRNRKPDRR